EGLAAAETQAESGSLAAPAVPLADDFLEQVAERTFAISPRLGAIGEDISGTDTAGRDAYVVAAPAADKSVSIVPAPGEDTLAVEPEGGLAPVPGQEELPLGGGGTRDVLESDVLGEAPMGDFDGLAGSLAGEMPPSEFAGTELLTGRTSAQPANAPAQTPT